MIYCKELDRNFDNKEDLFKALRENATSIIDVKKANIYKSVDKGSSIKTASVIDTDVIKADATFKENYIYPVINTIGYLDSHNDLHITGLFNKSAREQQGNIFYVADHELKTTTTIAWKSDVKLLIKDIEWSLVGKSYSGKTQALIFEIAKDKIRLDIAKSIINDKLDVENSVRMRYYNIALCYNSDKEEDKEYKKNFDKYYPQIANKEDFENIIYFYAVLEAGIVSEGSMVLQGSNDATRVIQSKIEPTEVTQTTESTADKSHSITVEPKKISIYNLN